MCHAANFPFMGQIMKCVMCGMEQASNPTAESQWRALEIDGEMFYACPRHLPPDGATKEEFEAAYREILETIVAKIRQRRATFR